VPFIGVGVGGRGVRQPDVTGQLSGVPAGFAPDRERSNFDDNEVGSLAYQGLWLA
jgi:hypothetical protein